MANVDPKQILLANKLLVGVYALALLPIGLYFPLVLGGAKGSPRVAGTFLNKAQQLKQKARAADRLADRITEPDPEAPVYTERHVAAFGQQAELYRKELAALAELVAQQDVALERWFDDDKFKDLVSGEDPPSAIATEFNTYWTNVAIPKLVERYRGIVVPEGADLDQARVFDRAPAANELRRFQKYYWIQEAILEAILRATEGDLATLRSEPQLSEKGQGEDDGQPLYDLVDVRLELACRFRQIPRLVRELLSRKISMKIASLEVEKAPFRIADPNINLLVDGMGGTFNEVYYTGELASADEFKGEDKIEEYLPEPKVNVTLTVQVYDFDPPPPPAPEGEGEDAMMMDDAMIMDEGN